MDKPNISKVVIDTSISEKIPTVAVSSPVKPNQEEEANINISTKENFITQLPRRIGTLVSDFLETIVVSLSIFVVVYLFLVQPHEVKGNSMEPNFHNNEYILTDKISYRFKHPDRGDVVIFKAPKNPDVDYIKRVIGLPGEEVRVENGRIYINNVPLDEYYLKDTTTLFPGSLMQEGVNLKIDDNEYFVLGDNRFHSSDSREFGPIPQNSIIGRAFIRYWPLNILGPIQKINYSFETASDR